MEWIFLSGRIKYNRVGSYVDAAFVAFNHDTPWHRWEWIQYGWGQGNTPSSFTKPDNQVRGGQHEAQLGPVGPILAPCWPHESCNQGKLYLGISSDPWERVCFPVGCRVWGREGLLLSFDILYHITSRNFQEFRVKSNTIYLAINRSGPSLLYVLQWAEFLELFDTFYWGSGRIRLY